MIRLKRLYSDPPTFNPIIFDSGVNLILGERVEDGGERTDQKTIGVGKSMCIEFINFCLLKDEKDSRVMQIPSPVFSPDIKIILDIQIGDKSLTIIRTTGNPTRPWIRVDSSDHKFLNMEDALNFLDELARRAGVINDNLSFRELMGPLVRDEDSEFSDIISCYDLKRKIPSVNLIKPHLFFFGINLELIDKLKRKIREIEDFVNSKKILEKELTHNKTKKLSAVKAEANLLEDEVRKINQAIESFEANEAFEALQNDLTDVNNKIDTFRKEQESAKYQIKRIQSLPKVEIIDKEEIELVYNQFREGLGDLITKSLNQVQEFKDKIDNFQNRLISSKENSLRIQLEEATEAIRELERKKSEKLKLIDTKGILRDIKTSVSIYDQKTRELNQITTKIENYEEISRKVTELEAQQGELFLNLQNVIFGIGNSINHFQKTILEIHEFIMGNHNAHFDIRTKKGKDVLEFEYRIDADGSYSVDRTKVFIYDMALLFDDVTRKRHPKFLIHDNIFNVDTDTLIQSLNFLGSQENKYNDFQYILTLNKDFIEASEVRNKINLNIEEHKKAAFTKQNKFLKIDYQQLR